MGRLVASIKRFNMVLYGVSSVFVIFVALITFVDVVGRYFRFPLPGTLELSQLMLVCMIYLTLAHTQAQKGHIFLDFSIPLPQGVKVVVDILLTLLSLFVMSVFTWKSVPFILDAFRSNEWSDYHHMPIFIFKISLFIGGLTFCLQLIIDIIEICRKPRELAGGNHVA
jgi:TRAP-type C4-dicarboxylate transport system permease small subunit